MYKYEKTNKEFEAKIKYKIFHYTSSVLTVFSSRTGSLPQFIVKTILCKNPAILFNVEGMKEIISHKFNGYLVDC